MRSMDTAIILAGGKSSRMGFDKQFLKFRNKYIIELLLDKLESMFKEIVIVTNKPDEYVKYNCILAEDEVKDFGPVAGISVGLKHSSSMYNYIIACDMPYVNSSYIDFMKAEIAKQENDVDAVITRLGDWIEPFNAFYSKSLIVKAEENIRLGRRRINSLFKDSNVIYISEAKAREYSPNWEMFMNLNTVKDYEDAIKSITGI
jgi:molybdopterin-guanine dinucleotide biosynthesis protein A